MPELERVAATSLRQKTFSKDAPEPGQPRLRWPGDPASQDVKTMNSGQLSFAPGVQMTIRNSVTHGLDGLDEQAALDHLSTPA